MAASRAVVVIMGGALIAIGIGFAGYAIMLAMLPQFGAVRAAAITAAILLVVPASYLVMAALRPPARTVPTRTAARTETAMLGALATVAREKPLLAVLAAVLLGGADVLLRERR